MLARLQHKRGNADLLRLSQCVSHQSVGAFSTLLRLKVVRFIEVNRVDFVFMNELLNLDRLGMFKIGLVQIFVRDLDISIFLVLVTSSDLLPRNLGTFGITEFFIRYRTHIRFMEVVKRK